MKSKHTPMILIMMSLLLFTGCQNTASAPTLDLSSDPVILLERMLKNFEESIYTQTGWLHYKYTYESDLENGIVFPDDSIMPKEYVWESWYLVNEEGIVIESVTSLIDLEGSIIQQAVFANGTEYNLTFNINHTNLEDYPLLLDLGVARMMLQGYENGLPLSSETDEIDGRAVIRFILNQQYDDLNYISGSSQPVQAANMELVLDQNSGEILESKTVFILEDNTQELLQRQYDFTIEWAELPQELGQLIEDVKSGSIFDMNETVNSQPATREEILERLTKLNDRGAEKYLSPGWLHVAESTMHIITDNFDENGNPIPVLEDVTHWYLLGENGEVLQHISFTDIGNSSVAEIVVYQEKTFTNLTYPEKSSAEPEDFYLTALDFGLLEYLQDHPDLELEMIEETIGLVTITTTEMYENEITDENGITAAGMFRSYLLDISSGKGLVIEYSYIMPDGSLMAKEHFLVDLVEKLNAPPDYILEYFGE